MKKNIFTVIIFALALVNVVLTAVIIFTVVPTSNKTNKLIQQIASVVDLELESKEKQEEEDGEVKPGDVESYKIELPSSNSFNLKTGADNKSHWGTFDSVTLSLNKSASDYKALKPTIEQNQAIIIDKVTAILGSYTFEEALLPESKEKMKAKALEEIQKYFDSTFIFGISFEKLVFQ